MIRAIIFDFFGVISLKGHDAFLDRAVTDPTKRAELRNLGRQHDLGLLDTDTYHQAQAQAAQTTVAEVERAVHSERTLNKPLLNLIRAELKPKYKIGMLSNAGGDLRTFVGHDILTELFDDVLISSEVGMVKPDPRLYHLACERLDVTPTETLMVDDLIGNCEGAETAGLEAIHYQDFSTFHKLVVKSIKMSSLK